MPIICVVRLEDWNGHHYTQSGDFPFTIENAEDWTEIEISKIEVPDGVNPCSVADRCIHNAECSHYAECSLIPYDGPAD